MWNDPSRRRVILLGIAGAAAALLAAMLVTVSGEGPTPEAVARDHAERACAAMRDVIEDISRDASADRVLEAVDSAVSSANAAADFDPRWRSLAGGMQAVRFALQEDDPDAARIGGSVLIAQCRDAGFSFAEPQ